MVHRAFVAFSGGGAKGVVHVGALKALEERGVELLGLSGTSAGSIVASLVAAGFRADELIDSTTGGTIMDQLKIVDPRLRRATDLFGGRWAFVRALRSAARVPLFVYRLLFMAWLALPAVGCLAQAHSESTYILPAGIFVWMGFGLTIWLGYRFSVGGLSDVRRFRDALALLLQRRMFPEEAGREVLFRDFGKNNYPTLKIVSANLSQHTLHLFSPERTPNVGVADAVAASICLPIVFSPWRIDTDLHIDGGIVSNLPAWPFDEERELDPEALTIAVEVEVQPETAQLSRYSWLGAAIRTGLFGSGELSLRVSGHSEKLALPTQFGLLDFDRPAAEAAREVREVATAAGLRLDKRLIRLPEIYRHACEVAQALALDGLGIEAGQQDPAPRIRVAIGRFDRGYRNSLRLSYSVGFEGDTDEASLLPIQGSIAGAAWTSRQSQLEVSPFPPSLDLPGRQNRLRRKTRWRSLEWTLCVPILDDATGRSRLLVQLEGNWPLARTAATSEALSVVEGAVKDFFGQVLDQLELEDDG